MKNQPAIILCRPQMGENIGAAARAMLNFGLSDLRLVAPRDGWPNDAAIAMAAKALDVITPTVYGTLSEALTGCHYALATTTRERGVVKPIFTGRGAVVEALSRVQQNQNVAFVFGPERTGLENDEVALCNGIITIPVNPEFYSLNLAQAVLLVSYEWLMAQDQTPAQALPRGDSAPVEHEKLSIFLDMLEADLFAAGFFKTPEQKPIMQRNIRALFTRSDLTAQELQTLHGVIKALKNSAGNN